MRITRITALVFIMLFKTAGVYAQGAYLSPNQKAGELSYRLVSAVNPNGSPNIYYHITLKMVVECQYEAPAVVPLYITNLDDPLRVKDYAWVFDSASNKINVADPCIAFSYPPCYRVYYYHIDQELQINHGGYRLFYADCCRDYFQNLRIDGNISSYEMADLPGSWSCGSPGGGDLSVKPCLGPVYNGIAYITNIPSRFKYLYNSSPVFENGSDTVLYVCTNNQFSHVFNATDPDGDSLGYSFYVSKTWFAEGVGSGSIKLDVSGNIEDMRYMQPKYTPAQPLGEDVTIDPKTGLLQGKLRDTGSYLVTVAVDEYRNGQKITLTPHTRDVVIRAFDCSKLPVPQAILPASVRNCDSNTIFIPNNSIPYHPELYWDNNIYQWDLGDGSTSADRNPKHTYDTGTYNLRLITMPGYRCADTATMQLLVYPAVYPKFTIAGQGCTGVPIKFINQSHTDIGYINSLTWTFTNLKDSTSFTSKLSTPTYVFKVPNQTYSAVLDITTTKGCEAKDTQFINIWQSPLPLSVHDTILTAGIPYPLLANAGYDSAANVFIWSPAVGLDNPYIANPVATGSQDITYKIQMTNIFGCSLTDTIHLVYYKGPDIYLPTAFTPNGDGHNDVLRPLPVGIQKLEFFRVFNRWGNIVFETQAYLAGWDGTIGGRQAPAGTYIYQARGVDFNKKTVFKKGAVTLIR